MLVLRHLFLLKTTYIPGKQSTSPYVGSYIRDQGSEHSKDPKGSAFAEIYGEDAPHREGLTVLHKPDGLCLNKRV